MVEVLREIVAEPTEEHARVASLLAVLEVDIFVSKPRLGRGRPCRDRAAIARAFVAKCVLQCVSTECLRRRLQADEGLRRCIGLSGRVPSAATFSRAFREMCEQDVGSRVHEALVRREYSQVDIWHLSRDATPIANWEQAPRKGKKGPKAKKRPGRKKGVPAAPRVQTRQEKQLKQTPEEAFEELAKECAIGAKLDSKGHPRFWSGYKLHVDVDETGFPLSFELTGANVHDSQVAIPLMKTTTQRVRTVLYHLMDAGYVGKPIIKTAHDQNQVAIVQPKATPTRPAIPLEPDRKVRLNNRNAVERFFAQLKSNYGLGQLRYRTHIKVKLCILFAILAHCAKCILKRQANEF